MRTTSAWGTAGALRAAACRSRPSVLVALGSSAIFAWMPPKILSRSSSSWVSCRLLAGPSRRGHASRPPATLIFVYAFVGVVSRSMRKSETLMRGDVLDELVGVAWMPRSLGRLLSMR